jgi:hypothetical protein
LSSFLLRLDAITVRVFAPEAKCRTLGLHFRESQTNSKTSCTIFLPANVPEACLPDLIQFGI